MAFRNIGMYVDSENCTYHLNNLSNYQYDEWAMYSDLAHFLNSGHPKNIAVLHWPYPYNPAFADKVNKLYDRCDKICIIITELHQVSMEFIQQFDREKITYFLTGVMNTPPANAKVYEYYDWFETSRFFYKDYLPEILTRIHHKRTKPRYFDILLGRKKLHRDRIYSYVKSNLDEDSYVMRYFNTTTETKIADDYDVWISERQGLKIDKPLEWTVDRVSYYGHNMSVSQVIPISVYNKTAYSVIAETNWASYYKFFTEKTAKPIIAKRLFIMIAGQGYLQTLRDIGFKTFDGIIDESYDTITDDLYRWEAAGKQMKWLCEQDQYEILQQIQPIVDHNFNVMMSKDWYGEFIQKLENEISSIVQQT